MRDSCLLGIRLYSTRLGYPSAARVVSISHWGRAPSSPSPHRPGVCPKRLIAYISAMGRGVLRYSVGATSGFAGAALWAGSPGREGLVA